MRKRITHLLLALAIVVCSIGGGASVYGASTVTDRIDGVSTSLAIKAPVRVATTANITLSGLQTVDGVLLTTGERVLVKNQTTATANGIYQANTSSWSRALDFDGNRDVATGTTVAVTAGSTNINTYWRVSVANPITVGTTSITWERASVSDGATVSFLQAGTGAVTRTLQDKARETVSTLDYGCAADGTTDDTTCLNNLFANTGKRCFLTKGTYKYTAILTAPVCSIIEGEGPTESILAPAAGVTKGLALNSVIELRNFRMTGNATTGAIGIIFGDTTAIYAYGHNVQVDAFTGTSALGVQIKQVLKSYLDHLTLIGNRKNILVSGTAGLPTTVFFNYLYNGTSLGVGMDVLNGALIVSNHGVHESNAAEAIYLRPTAIDVTEFVSNDEWYEDNNGANIANYTIVSDGTGGRTTRLAINGGYDAGGASFIRIHGAGNTGFVIKNTQVANQAATIRIENNSSGFITLPINLVYATVVSSTSCATCLNSLSAAGYAGLAVDVTGKVKGAVFSTEASPFADRALDVRSDADAPTATIQNNNGGGSAGGIQIITTSTTGLAIDVTANSVNSMRVDQNGTRTNRVYFNTATEPTCNSTNRGAVVLVQGGAGVADTFRICTKDGADAYAYRALF